MCHVLTVFSFTHSVCSLDIIYILSLTRLIQAKYAYRSIAEFVKHVSHYDAEHLKRNPFPELHRPPSEISPETEAVEKQPSTLKSKLHDSTRPEPESERKVSSSDVRMFKQNEATAKEEVGKKYTDAMPASHRASEKTLDARDQDKTVMFPCVVFN
jgi:hypothetical protein